MIKRLVLRGPVKATVARAIGGLSQVKALQTELASAHERAVALEAEAKRLRQQMAGRPADSASPTILVTPGDAAAEAEHRAVRVFAGLEPPPSRAAAPVTCRMAEGLYIQADGSLPCYCSAGITRKLGQVDGAELMEFYRGPTMTALRAHLAQGVFPWPECEGCHVKSTEAKTPPALLPEAISVIHVEPTSICNLRCPGCRATDVMEGREPRRRAFLPFDKFKAMVDSIDRPVRLIGFCGYGEPLLNPELPKMIAYAKARIPGVSCSIDTNANIRRIDAAELIASGVNLIRFALDGAFQENYVQYRRRGNIELALRFVRAVAAERDRQQAKTKLVWKYVIFDHASSAEELEHAIRFCGEVGIGFDYSRAAGVLPGADNRDELVPRIEALLRRYGVGDFVGGDLRHSDRAAIGQEDAWKFASP